MKLQIVYTVSEKSLEDVGYKIIAVISTISCLMDVLYDYYGKSSLSILKETIVEDSGINRLITIRVDGEVYEILVEDFELVK